MSAILRLIRWLWRHTSRVERSMLCEGGTRIMVEEVRLFCSSPSCTCGREKRVAPPLVVVKRLGSSVGRAEERAYYRSLAPPWARDVPMPDPPRRPDDRPDRRPPALPIPGPGVKSSR